MTRLVVKANSVSIGSSGEVIGIAWPFGSPDSEGDVIRKGAISFAKNVPMVIEHAQEHVVGIWQDFEETDDGLVVKGQLFIEGIGPAREAHRKLKSRQINGLSISWIGGDSVARPGGGREYTNITVNEISLCRDPAHPGARVINVKSATGGKGNKLGNALKKTKAVEDQVPANDNVAEDEDVTVEEVDERVDALEAELAEIKELVTGTNESVAEVTKSVRRLVTKSARPGAKVEAPESAEETAKKAFVSYLRRGEDGTVTKSLRRGSDPKGGYLAPPEFVKELIREIVEFSPIRENSFVGSTGNSSVIIPGRVGRTNAKWKGETETQEESTFDFEEQEIAIHEINTFVDVSNQLLEDSEVDVEAEIRLAFAEDLGGKENEAFLFGDGVKKPNGFMVDPRVSDFASGAAATVGADALIQMLYSVPQVYRSSGVWTMNGTTLGFLRTLKDGEGNYIWRPGLTEGQPETLLGRPVVEALDMPDIAADATPIVFGDLKQAYRIYDRTDIEVLVNPYLLATESKTRFHLRKRLGAGVVRPSAIKKLRIAAS